MIIEKGTKILDLKDNVVGIITDCEDPCNVIVKLLLAGSVPNEERFAIYNLDTKSKYSDVNRVISI